MEAYGEQVYQVVGLQPVRQPALVGRLVAEIADANTERADAMLVGIERAEALAEQLAEAVTGIRLRHGLDADLGRALMEAHDVIGGGENHPLDALLAGGLEQVVAADEDRKSVV